MKGKIELNKIDIEIIDVLKKAEEPITAYEIAKRIGSHWDTTRQHLWKIFAFKSKFKIKLKKEVKRRGYMEKTLWSIRR